MKKKFLVFAMVLFLLAGSTFSIFVSHIFSDYSVQATNHEEISIHFIDVDQGDSIFIDTSVKDVLIDGGKRNAGNTVLSYLQTLGITQIHLMVATHMDADHIGGLITVLESTMQVDEILVNNQNGTTVTYDDFIALANAHLIKSVKRGEVYVLTDMANLTVLNPVQPLEFSHQNENSVVLMLRIGESSFLLTGDAEADTEESMLLNGLDLKCDVLKVGHHGSRYSSTTDFLDAVSPSYAVISAGEDNSYGHPHSETLDSLLDRQVIVYGTYLSGNIVALANSTNIEFLNNPQVIPEFSSIILVFLLISILLGLIIHKIKEV